MRSYAKTNVTMIFLAIFRSRSTYYQLCTTLGAPEHVPNTSQRRPYGSGVLMAMGSRSGLPGQGVALPWGSHYYEPPLICVWGSHYQNFELSPPSFFRAKRGENFFESLTISCAGGCHTHAELDLGRRVEQRRPYYFLCRRLPHTR